MWSEPASAAYASITFKSPSDVYNQPAPDPLCAWIVGGVLSLLTVVYWYYYRWRAVLASLAIDNNSSSNYNNRKRDVFAPTTTHHMLSLRIILSSISDNDNPTFTMLRVSSQSMLLLAGFQIDYKLTLTVLLVYYTVISCTDSLRVLLSLREADSLQDLVVVSKRDRRFILPNVQLAASQCQQGVVATIDVKSQNVYEDISRAWSVVLLVFVTQFVLIAFVVVDAYKLETHTVLDTTKDVPIVGTLGSYLIYILGIFMQCVYLLGPKTSFGTSEQNPHFWVQLLLAAKKSGCHCTWTTEDDGVKHGRVLRQNDLHLWVRFVLSFVINGVGFHVLVHALPIQVAGQANLTGVVVRAVGMLYLVDLDDAPGTVLKLVEYHDHDESEKAAEAELLIAKQQTASSSKRHNNNNNDDDDDMHQVASTKPSTTTTQESSTTLSSLNGNNEVVCDNADTTVPNKTAEELIERARLQADLMQRQLQKDLDALANANDAAEAKKQQQQQQQQTMGHPAVVVQQQQEDA